MSYMNDLEARLKQLLSALPEEEQATLIREINAIALESYRNGQKAGAPAAKSGEKRESAKAAPAKS